MMHSVFLSKRNLAKQHPRGPRGTQSGREKRAVYKSGTGTRGRGHRDACVGTWDVGTRDEGLEDIKYGTRGRVGRGRGGVKNRDAGDAGCE